MSFDHQLRTRIVSGNASIDRVGELANQLGAQRVLLVTDPGVSAAGHTDRVRKNLEAAGIAVAVYDQVRENPTDRDVEACHKAARQGQIDLFVGLGGGSSLDTAKGSNFVLTNGGQIADYRGKNNAAKPLLPMIAIPTTAGTGSEVQSFAIIAEEDTQQKMACGDVQATPAIAILDPTLTLTQPWPVAAATGVDAITHAVESFVTTIRTPLSMMYAREAFRLTITNFPRVLATKNDPAATGNAASGSTELKARGRMLLGASLAGLAIENSMLGAAHSAANPLTAHFKIVHGWAVGLMLPHVIRFNAEHIEAQRSYAELARDTHAAPSNATDPDAFAALVTKLESVFEDAGVPRNLAVCGVKANDVPHLAKEAAQHWTGQFNPRPITEEGFLSLYQAVLGKPD